MLVNFAVVLSRFEAESLQIPLCLHFLTTGADLTLIYHEAFLLFVALLHVFITLPLMNWAHGCIYGNRQPLSWASSLRRCGKRYLLVFVTFWTVTTVVRIQHDDPKLGIFIERQVRFRRGMLLPALSSIALSTWMASPQRFPPPILEKILPWNDHPVALPS
jgi:hypothetical protein